MNLGAVQAMSAATDEEIALQMRYLRAQINALDAQRELMQINASYMDVLGRSLSKTAEDVLMDIGPGIPEHQMGLSGVSRLGLEISKLAKNNDVEMLVRANEVRNQCATCHTEANPPGGVDWDHIFRSDWNHTVLHCNTQARSPYLCRSMNGMLSAYGTLLTAYEAEIENFEMVEYSATEIVRILKDLKAKNFRHLPENLRMKAEKDAADLLQLAVDRNPDAFQKAPGITAACTQCHAQAASGGGWTSPASMMRSLTTASTPVSAWLK